MPQQFLRFALVGLLNTAVGYSVIMLLNIGAGLSPVLSNLGGYLVGGGISYLLNRQFTFNSRQAHGVAVPRFLLAWCLCFALNLLVLQVGIKFLGWSVPVSQAVSVCVFTLAFYVANKWVVFRR